MSNMDERSTERGDVQVSGKTIVDGYRMEGHSQQVVGDFSIWYGGGFE